MVSERSRHITPFSTGPQRRQQAIAPATSLPRAAAQANSTATDTAGIVSDFNALLAKLRAANLMAP